MQIRTPTFNAAVCETEVAIIPVVRGGLLFTRSVLGLGFEPMLPNKPADINVDGCVQLYDLLDLLSACGDCSDEESEWQCVEPRVPRYDYATVQIGEQYWFAENLRAENCNNSEEIPSSLSDGTWSSTLGATAVMERHK